ncbi:Potassium uptake transporter [Aspergillus sclerotialis]|uniref:Potassium uptake transporter n=1 Tax=Aspergillus sclerotialis TaxID=2070753 RepID=A0A3A2ZEJ4_9EURO|nr:Potassium uptake transporter [Aspergillus sclerotialis]
MINVELTSVAPTILSTKAQRANNNDQEACGEEAINIRNAAPEQESSQPLEGYSDVERQRPTSVKTSSSQSSDEEPAQPPSTTRSVAFADSGKTLHIPSPRERDQGLPIHEVEESSEICDDDTESEVSRRRWRNFTSDMTGIPLQQVASSMFVIGRRPREQGPPIRRATSLSRDLNLPGISSQASVGRNSQFYNLTAEDRETIGGIEYRALKVLLKIVIGYFIGLHLLGVIGLVPWILHANPKYRDYLEECGQGKVWWAFYSAQTMVSNLGFTLTPDSMVSFQDATWPMLLMSFLAFAGNTLYPCLLRLVIWTIHKCVPRESSLKEPLDYLLKYPRRCYVLLFPSKPTWILFGVIFLLNAVDVLLIIVLDLNNPAVNNLPGGPRVLAAIFQAASSRHTGTATFSLGDVNPAVQFSLLVMMYIAIFPIALSIRASNTYEERTLGVFSRDLDLDEQNSARYLLSHVRNQLSFDLWYIFLGIFCICISESDRITRDTSFSVFSIFFEVVSAYGNVGLSLGYPTVKTSLSGQFNTFSKVVICIMMIRGRHRGLPYQLDRAILLPNERLLEDDRLDFPLPPRSSFKPYADKPNMPIRKCYTQ